MMPPQVKSSDKAWNSFFLPQAWEISTRPWLYKLSQKYGKTITLNNVPFEELETIIKKGVKIIWLMGIWSLGKYGLQFDRTNHDLLKNYGQVLPDFCEEDIIGSPFAVTSYDINPEVGTLEGLTNLKRKLNSNGIKLMTDFVPNHTAVDASWVTQNPDYYVRAPKDLPPPYSPELFTPSGFAYGNSGYGAWHDTLQLNYWNSNLRIAQIENLLKVAAVSDYIRCDMSHLILNQVIEINWGKMLKSWGYSAPNSEFWTDAIKNVKIRYPNVQFLAEAYDSYPKQLQKLGFDFTYDKTLYDLLVVGHLDNIRNYIKHTPIEYFWKTAHFVENHDEPRAAAVFGGNMRADMAAVLSMTLPGMRLFNQGQDCGYTARLDIHLRRSKPETVNEGVQDFYRLLYEIISSKIFHIGKWVYVDILPSSNSWRLIAWKWFLSGKSVLVVVNYSDSQGEGAIILEDAQPLSHNSTDIYLRELMSGIVYERNVQELKNRGLYVVIPCWSCQVFQYESYLLV
ncbi:uncharacterized protein LOC126318199 isoform X1 [Schistocerca gregaria]|uniref:uncharacterized protein LOC126318199 isoform X1 n=1 Tax=Schistocerca gregaria TaxID=7010 RepID=UPI00211EE4FC|nr:uncharacterized protein LOC126318199 isoform X1 [Schistocerca gregaria]